MPGQNLFGSELTPVVWNPGLKLSAFLSSPYWIVVLTLQGNPRKDEGLEP